MVLWIFFENASFNKPVNCTASTLVPKVENAFYAKDYRPISCCSIIFKLIFKILKKKASECGE